MTSPDCKRQKLADDANSVAKMSKPTVIDVNAQKFEDVAKMDGFVDRTMLIQELLEGTSFSAMMLAPSKFGKTVNLDMIRLFCDIEDKNTKTKEDVAKDPTMEGLRSNPSKNMKVFLRQFGDTKYEECLILKQENFFIQHFGRHPVVLFNFKDCTAENESGAIFDCAKQVRIGYLENEYLKNSKEFHSSSRRHRHLKQTCTDWINYSDVELESLSLSEVMDGLKNLIQSLRIHWERLPVFLVDEVDKPCVAAIESQLSQKQVHEIRKTVTKVICSILKTDEEQLTLQAALLTGICKIQSYEMSSVDNTLSVYCLMDHRFSKYYGLTALEVESLVRKFYGAQGEAEIRKIISDIDEKYNGYYQYSPSGKNKKYARYCLFSVLNYIENLNKDSDSLCFWSDGGFLTGKFVAVLKKSVKFRSTFQKLLYGDSGTIAIRYESEVDVHHLLELYREEMNMVSTGVFTFFIHQGYLADNLEKRKENVGMRQEMYVRIPNLEIKSIYEKMFEEYYGSLPEHIQSKLTSCGQIFKSLPTQDSTEFRNSLDELCEHLKCIFRFMQCQNESSMCSHILAILKHNAEYEKCETKDFNNTKPCRVYIDVWGCHGNFAVIFDVKFNDAASGEPENIGYKSKSSFAAAKNIVELLPGKINPDNEFESKAGTGSDLEVLNSQIEHYVLIGLAVDGDYTTHMLVFRDTSDWKNVIQVNPENHVAELISTHLKSEIPVV